MVALDHYVWGVDWVAREKYWNECAERGVLPDHGRDATDFWDDSLPGRRPFDFTRSVLDSRVESVVADFTTVDLDSLGQFDVVLYLGVLYHMPEPLTCLQRLRRVTRRVAAISTVGLNVPGMNDQRLLQFQPGNELGADFGNWFVPSVSALESLCLAAGFARRRNHRRATRLCPHQRCRSEAQPRPEPLEHPPLPFSVVSFLIATTDPARRALRGHGACLRRRTIHLSAPEPPPGDRQNRTDACVDRPHRGGLSSSSDSICTMLWSLYVAVEANPAFPAEDRDGCEPGETRLSGCREDRDPGDRIARHG